MSRAPSRIVATRACIGALGLLLLQGCDSGADTEPNPVPQPPADTVPPSAPASLTATAVDADRVELSWTPSTDASGVAGYRISRQDLQTVLTTVTTTSYADTTVAANTQYTYTVSAFDAADNASAPSPAATVTTPAPAAGANITLERYTDIVFTRPVAMLQAPNDSSRWFIVQQSGSVMQVAATNPSAATPFINIEGQVVNRDEMGLLGMAFHPNFPADPRVFLSYTTGNPLVSRVSVFTTADNGATLNPASEQVLLRVNQPEENHNGGQISFGPDGYLYIGFGDGGGGGDQHGDIGNGQRLTTLLGKMLRIDINGAAPYAIPPSNPFAAQTTRCPPEGRTSGECPEIYAWGFRNPWRWSFDRETAELWVADVGQQLHEEVNQVTLGGNYGWRCREGAHDFASATTPSCSTSMLIDPIAEYGRDLGNSITGGYVYRGSQATSLRGRYLFADFGSGRIFAWIQEEANTREPRVLLESGLNISSFGEGHDGELYIVHYGGTLHRIVFTTN